MISMLFLNISKFLTIFPYLAIYSEPLCATYASFGGGGSQMRALNQYLLHIGGRPVVLVPSLTVTLGST